MKQATTSNTHDTKSNTNKNINTNALIKESSISGLDTLIIKHYKSQGISDSVIESLQKELKSKHINDENQNLSNSRKRTFSQMNGNNGHINSNGTNNTHNSDSENGENEEKSAQIMTTNKNSESELHKMYQSYHHKSSTEDQDIIMENDKNNNKNPKAKQNENNYRNRNDVIFIGGDHSNRDILKISQPIKNGNNNNNNNHENNGNGNGNGQYAMQYKAQQRIISETAFGGKYQCSYHKTHDAQISAMTFSNNGIMAATGCVNGSIRVFRSNKMSQTPANFSSIISKSDNKSYYALHRQTFYNTTMHTNSKDKCRVNEIDFHPNICYLQHLVVGLSNGSIKFYPFYDRSQKADPKMSFKECYDVKTVQYHPSGLYIIAGGSQNFIRLYDFNEKKGYKTKHLHDSDYGNHDINQIRFSQTGNIFVAGNESGNINIYDIRNMQSVHELTDYHSTFPVHSVRFSLDCNYLLSNGCDDVIRLTDLRMLKQVMEYECVQTNVRSQAVFTCNNEHILCHSDAENMNKVMVFDTNTGQQICQNLFEEHHQFRYSSQNSNNNNNNGSNGNIGRNVITAIAASPVDPYFMCSSLLDKKFRFYSQSAKPIEYGNYINLPPSNNGGFNNQTDYRSNFIS